MSDLEENAKKESTTGRTCEDQLEHIIATCHSIDLTKITILVGPNGSGKSLLRGQIQAIEHGEGNIVVHNSMAFRTGLHSHMGGLGVFARDSEWDATSYNTIKFLHTSSRSVEGKYWVIDEPGIGCSEETLAALPGFLNAMIARSKAKGVLVITHSRAVAGGLEHNDFFDLGHCKTVKGWLSREVIRQDLELLEANHLFYYVRDYQKAKKDKK